MTEAKLRIYRRMLAVADDLHDVCARAACIPQFPGATLAALRVAWHSAQEVADRFEAQTARTPKRPTRPGPRVTKKV